MVLVKKDNRYFTKLFVDQTSTELWLELDAYDVFVYTELLTKRSQGKNGKPETFILTPKMMNERISTPRFYKSISNLLKRGFIDIQEHGGIGTEGENRANIYILSTKWQWVDEKRKEPGSENYLLERPHSPRYNPNLKEKKKGK